MFRDNPFLWYTTRWEFVLWILGLSIFLAIGQDTLWWGFFLGGGLAIVNSFLLMRFVWNLLRSKRRKRLALRSVMLTLLKLFLLLIIFYAMLRASFVGLVGVLLGFSLPPLAILATTIHFAWIGEKHLTSSR